MLGLVEDSGSLGDAGTVLRRGWEYIITLSFFLIIRIRVPLHFCLIILGEGDSAL